MSGSGIAVVCSVGNNRCIIDIEGNQNLVGVGAEGEDDLTPLQKKLSVIADELSKYGYTAGFLIFVTMAVYLFLSIFFTSDRKMVTSESLMSILNIFSIACAIIIVAVPEGLPLSISIAMAFSISIFKEDKLLLKKLEACENMGSIHEICTGKTATLTKNDMSVNRFYTAKKSIENRDPDTFKHCGLSEKVMEEIKNVIYINNDCRIEMSDDAMYVPEGNGTEIGLLKFLTDNEIAIQDLFANKRRHAVMETNIPFGPIRKRQVVAIRPEEGSAYVRVIVKGAPEYVLPMCTSQMDENGNNEEIDESERDRILNQEIVEKFAKQQSLRTMAFAQKLIPTEEYANLKAENNEFINEEDRVILENDLTFVVAFGLNDELRDGVNEVV